MGNFLLLCVPLVERIFLGSLSEMAVLGVRNFIMDIDDC